MYALKILQFLVSMYLEDNKYIMYVQFTGKKNTRVHFPLSINKLQVRLKI